MTKGKTKKKNSGSGVLKFSLYILFILAAVLFIRYFCLMRTVVEGSSMEPTLNDGDNLLVDELSFHFTRPRRFEIVVFPDREQGGYIIKRVIGMPGEKVEIFDGSVFIDGNLLQGDTYGAEPMADAGVLKDRAMLLGEDEYFVLGDNRNESVDSRSEGFGAVRRKQIAGRAFWRLLPVWHFGPLKRS